MIDVEKTLNVLSAVKRLRMEATCLSQYDTGFEVVKVALEEASLFLTCAEGTLEGMLDAEAEVRR